MDFLLYLLGVLLALVALAASLFLLGAVCFLLYYPLAAGWDGMKIFFHNRGWYNIDAE
jgi:hypothetical protein